MLSSLEPAAEAQTTPRQEPFEKSNEEALSLFPDSFGSSSLPLGISWHNISVRAIRANLAVKETFISQLWPHRLRTGSSRQEDEVIFQNSTGCVKPGEMLLLTGSSTSDCSLLLDVLAGRRSSFIKVQGDVRYGSMDYEEYAHYKRFVTGSSDERLLYPSLSVNSTLDFALRLVTSSNILKSEEEIENEKNWILSALGIRHLKAYRVGDDGNPGISNREKKLLALAEVLMLSSHGSFLFLNNVTSYFDGEITAQRLKTIKLITTRFELSTIVTMISPTSAELCIFDKVLTLEKCNAVSYGAGVDGTVPVRGSDVSSRRILKEEGILYGKSAEARNFTEIFKACHTSRNHKDLKVLGQILRHILVETKFSVLHNFQTLWLERKNLIIGHTSNVIQALTAASLFYKAPHDSSGFPKITGALFFSMLFHSLIPLKNIPDSFKHRNVAAKYGLLSRTWLVADEIAFSISDLIITIRQVSVFAVSFYFLVGLRPSAEAFFTYWMILLSMSQCLTGIFRFTGYVSRTLDGAFKAAGLISFATLVCCGYVVAEPQMPSWISWFFWVNPSGQTYDALVANEFRNSFIACIGANVVPTGPGYGTIDDHVCIGVGGAPRIGAVLSGDQYLSSQSYGTRHIWRNIAIMWAYWLVFSAATVLLRITVQWTVPLALRAGQVCRGSKRRSSVAATNVDQEMSEVRREERTRDCNLPIIKGDHSRAGRAGRVVEEAKQKPIFTWKDVTASHVGYNESTTILENIHGLIRAGSLTSFISPGSASTTALQVLAQQNLSGYKVDGVFSLSKEHLENCAHADQWAGYAECNAICDPFVTVREALEFSALLRQPQMQSRLIMEQIETIIDSLDLWDVADYLCGSEKEALSPLQRRKVTIGIELAACPTVLFAENPTSDLDVEAALEIMRILQKLATTGMAICISFEQHPSREILAAADTVMAINENGKQVYFGAMVCFYDIISDASSAKNYTRPWLGSSEYRNLFSEMKKADTQLVMVRFSATKKHKYQTSTWDQIIVATSRANTSMYRNTPYINNRIMLHIVHGLFNGFCFFHLPQSAQGAQLRQSTIFNFIFVATGVTAQQQPYFAERRRLYDASERNKGMYGKLGLTFSLILPELPYQCLCAFLYFACWYYTVGLNGDAERTGAIFLTMVLYKFLYTSVGQFIMACVSEPMIATLLNPLVFGNFVAFCGILVPYAQMERFWRSWFYWLNPFTYFIGSLLNFSITGMQLSCSESEAVVVDPMSRMTCGNYLADYLNDQGLGRDLLNPDATSACQICPYITGTDWLRTKNLEGRPQGWRYIGIMAASVVFFYATIFVAMGLRYRRSHRLVPRITEIR